VGRQSSGAGSTFGAASSTCPANQRGVGGGGGKGSAVNQSTDCALEQALVESRTTRQK